MAIIDLNKNDKKIFNYELRNFFVGEADGEWYPSCKRWFQNNGVEVDGHAEVVESGLRVVMFFSGTYNGSKEFFIDFDDIENKIRVSANEAVVQGIEFSLATEFEPQQTDSGNIFKIKIEEDNGEKMVYIYFPDDSKYFSITIKRERSKKTSSFSIDTFLS